MKLLNSLCEQTTEKEINTTRHLMKITHPVHHLLDLTWYFIGILEVCPLIVLKSLFVLLKHFQGFAMSLRLFAPEKFLKPFHLAVPVLLRKILPKSDTTTVAIEKFKVTEFI